MQSGKAKSAAWVLEFEPTDARQQDPLMGWTQTADTEGQVRLSFETKEEASPRSIPVQHSIIAFQLIDPKPAEADHQGLCRQLRLRPQGPVDALSVGQALQRP